MKVNEFVVFVMYEQLLINVKKRSNKESRTNAELSDKLFEVFEDNKRRLKKLARLYERNNGTIFDRIDYELKQIEDYKKRKYGDNYEVKPFAYAKNTCE